MCRFDTLMLFRCIVDEALPPKKQVAWGTKLECNQWRLYVGKTRRETTLELRISSIEQCVRCTIAN